MNAKKVAFYTLGCKLNFSETSAIARQFEGFGFVRATGGGADVCVVNTCSVTEHAEKKCRNLVRRLVRDNPGAVIAVTGCYAQLRPEALRAIEGVDVVVGNDDKGELFERVMAKIIPPLPPLTDGPKHALPPLPQRPRWFFEGSAPLVHDPGKIEHKAAGTDEKARFFPAFSSGDRTRAFLKVQDGCDYHCSYCTIPQARGASRNIPIAGVVAQAREIAAAGQREIVLTGVNTGDFGRTTREGFLDLLRALEVVEGIERYRISSIEPNLLTDDIIAFTAESPRFQPHFHIPLQSGCDHVLGLMRRRYTTVFFARRVAAVREKMPDAFIGVDVIVGFPGETDDHFEQTLAFLEHVFPAFIHVFPYSARPGTPAAEMPGHVAPLVSAARVQRLTELCDRLHRDFCARFDGLPARVLWESDRRNGLMAGYTENYVRVAAPWDDTRVGRITDAVLGKDVEIL